MNRRVVRTFSRTTIRVDTIHPQVGPITRGQIWADKDREGAGAYGVWHVVNADHESSPLAVVGDYLTAEQVLLDYTTWADEPIPADELDT